MPINRQDQNIDADHEANKLYAFIGKYVVSFQWLESKIDQSLMQARGYNNWEPSKNWLIRRTVSQKIDNFAELIVASKPFAPVLCDGWEIRVPSVIERLHRERHRRNELLHAHFVFDFLAIGYPILQIHRRLQGGVNIANQQDLSGEKFDAVLTELARLSFDLDLICKTLANSVDL